MQLQWNLRREDTLGTALLSSLRRLSSSWRLFNICLVSYVVVHYIHEFGKVSDDIRGYHAYINIWTPVQDEILRLIPEPANSVDRNAVAVMKEGRVVGHVPFNLALIISLFLRRDVNKAFVRVTGGKP